MNQFLVLLIWYMKHCLIQISSGPPHLFQNIMQFILLCIDTAKYKKKRKQEQNGKALFWTILYGKVVMARRRYGYNHIKCWSWMSGFALVPLFCSGVDSISMECKQIAEKECRSDSSAEERQPLFMAWTGCHTGKPCWLISPTRINLVSYSYCMHDTVEPSIRHLDRFQVKE
jgi:hypothetical protein